MVAAHMGVQAPVIGVSYPILFACKATKQGIGSCTSKVVPSVEELNTNLEPFASLIDLDSVFLPVLQPPSTALHPKLQTKLPYDLGMRFLMPGEV